MTQTIDGYVLLAFLPFLAVSPALGVMLSRRYRRPWLIITLSIASIAAIASETCRITMSHDG